MSTSFWVYLGTALVLYGLDVVPPATDWHCWLLIGGLVVLSVIHGRLIDAIVAGQRRRS